MNCGPLVLDAMRDTR